MKREWRRLSKARRRKRGRCSVTYVFIFATTTSPYAKHVSRIARVGKVTSVRTQAIVTDIRTPQTADKLIYILCYCCTRCTHGGMTPRSWPINSERCSVTVRDPEPNPYFLRLKILPNASLARWLGGMRFDHHHPNLLKEVADLCQTAPRRVLFQGAKVL